MIVIILIMIIKILVQMNQIIIMVQNLKIVYYLLVIMDNGMIHFFKWVVLYGWCGIICVRFVIYFCFFFFKYLKKTNINMGWDGWIII